ncbi:radical SAM protein [Candidatus Woesearchaeota archaeon]|nr:radical SAM protein [Candidatus Woesearchaeota archaeon]
MKKISKTPYYSKKIGKLPKGCRLCVKGEKSVFFITGVCSKKCFFCPISDEKKNNDVIYINEWQTKKKKDILKEVELCSSKGVGITGGDPLLRSTRTIKYIRLFKKKFSEKFHIHIYVPLTHVTKENLKKLNDAGLDEIRFHPDLIKPEEWEKIILAKKYSWDTGVEIPVIPKKEKQTKKLIDFIHDKVDFLNLNELEFSDTNYNQISEHGYKPKDSISYAVLGSENAAKRLMKYVIDKDYNLSVHYCTAKLKDRVQLASRIKKRAENIKKEYDIVTGSGILIRGAVFLPEFTPGFSYRKKIKDLSNIQKTKLLLKLRKLKNELKTRFDIPEELIEVDKSKFRILLEPAIINEIFSEIKYKCAIVKEFPTHDLFETEIEWLTESI